MKKTIINYVLAFILLSSMVFAVSSSVNTFYGQSNPFDINSSNRYDLFYLRFPLYVYFDSLNYSISFNSYPKYYWSFDTLDNDEDIINNVSLYNRGVKYVSGVVDEAREYNGTPPAYLNNLSGLISLPNAHTINFWYKEGEDITTEGVYTFMLDFRPSNAGYLSSLPASDLLYFDPSGVGTCIFSDFFYPSNFTMITLTVNTTSAKLYINGSFKNLSTSCHTNGIINSNITILNSRNFLNTVNNSIDELALYDSILSDSQIEYIYNLQKSGVRGVEYPKNISLTNSINNILNNSCVCDNCTIDNQYCKFSLNLSDYIYGFINITSSIYSYGLDNCSNSFNIPSNATALNISFFDNSGTPTNVDLQGNAVYTLLGINSPGGTYLFPSHNTNNDKLCVYPSYANIATNLSLDFSNAYNSYSYNTYNANLSNDTQNIKLYTQENSTYQCLLSVFDSSTNPIPNVFIEILKQNIAENTFVTTEILKSDSSGHAIGNFELGTTYYRMILEKDGEVLLTESSSLMVPSSNCEYLCCKNFFLSESQDTWFSDADITEGVQNSLYYNNDTGYFIFNWNDPSNLINNACLKVTKTNITGHFDISDQCTESQAGTIYYLVTEEQGARYTALSYLRFNNNNNIPLQIKEKFFNIISPSFKDSKMALFLGAFLILILFFIGLFNPTIGTFFLVVGVIAAFLLNFIGLSLAGVSTIVILWLLNEIVLHRKR